MRTAFILQHRIFYRECQSQSSHLTASVGSNTSVYQVTHTSPHTRLHRAWLLPMWKAGTRRHISTLSPTPEQVLVGAEVDGWYPTTRHMSPHFSPHLHRSWLVPRWTAGTRPRGTYLHTSPHTRIGPGWCRGGRLVPDHAAYVSTLPPTPADQRSWLVPRWMDGWYPNTRLSDGISGLIPASYVQMLQQ